MNLGHVQFTPFCENGSAGDSQARVNTPWGEQDAALPRGESHKTVIINRYKKKEKRKNGRKEK